MNRKRAFVGADGTADFSCPRCGRVERLSVPSGVRSSTPVRTRYRCRCGAAHVVFLERRAAVRKAVRLAATVHRPGTEDRAAVTIRNLSRTGLLFSPGGPLDADVGDLLVVDFALPGPRVQRFVKEVVIRRVGDDGVGAEFTVGPEGGGYDRVYDLALALYTPEGTDD